MESLYGRTPGALCLSRVPGEKILIGEDIEIMVVKIHGRRVYLSIVAPRQVEIDREEIRAAKRGTDARPSQPEEQGQVPEPRV